MIERLICIGCLSSTDYLRQIKPIWDVALIESVSIKKICLWSWEYYDQFNKAPGSDITGIYYEKLKANAVGKDAAEDIEELLESLSEEAFQEPVNLDYLLGVTKKQFNERRLVIHSETIQAYLARGQVVEAEQLACNYQPVADSSETDLNLSHPVVLERLAKAFDTTTQAVVKYPRHLGAFINDQLVKGSLVALLAPEKRGKTFILLDMALRAVKQGARAAFFSAGDMNEDELLVRIGIYLTRKNNDERYTGHMWEPVRDCALNQLNDCRRDERECDFGVFAGKTKEYLRRDVTQEELIEAYKENPDYKPCYNCHAYENNYWGAVWVKDVDAGNALTLREAQKAFDTFFIKNHRSFVLSCHSNDTLTVNQIRAILAGWEKQQQFVPDIIVIDYADILTTEERLDERPRQNSIWKNLRRLSQEKGNPLVVTATQSDADSYERSRLKLGNFSEDKRKYGHATCFISLNQDPEGREKQIGLLRMGKLAQRKGDYNIKDEITILQNLKRGRPFLTSYK